MLEFDPKDSKELGFAVYKAIKFSGLSNTEICDALRRDYQVDIGDTALSHFVSRGAKGFQRALQILAVCGVTEIRIKEVRKRAASD